MDKELEKLIKELKEFMQKLDEESSDKLKTLQNSFKKIRKEKVTINLDLNCGRLKVECSGSKNSILIALAVLENEILKRTMTPTIYFNLLKEILREAEVDLDE